MSWYGIKVKARVQTIHFISVNVPAVYDTFNFLIWTYHIGSVASSNHVMKNLPVFRGDSVLYQKLKLRLKFISLSWLKVIHIAFSGVHCFNNIMVAEGQMRKLGFHAFVIKTTQSCSPCNQALTKLGHDRAVFCSALCNRYHSYCEITRSFYEWDTLTMFQASHSRLIVRTLWMLCCSTDLSVRDTRYGQWCFSKHFQQARYIGVDTDGANAYLHQLMLSDEDLPLEAGCFVLGQCQSALARGSVIGVPERSFLCYLTQIPMSRPPWADTSLL